VSEERPRRGKTVAGTSAKRSRARRRQARWEADAEQRARASEAARVEPHLRLVDPDDLEERARRLREDS
jgi:hypothetical protein